MLLLLCFFLLLFFSSSFYHKSQKSYQNHPKLHSYVTPSRLCIPKISWKYVGLIAKHGAEISLKYWRSFGSALDQKMRTTKLYVILKKIIPKRIIYTQTTRKWNRLFSSYEHLKFLPCSQFNFT